MPIIRAQKVPKKTEPAKYIIARFCFHYHAYTYEQARLLPAHQLMMMLRIAQKEEARRMYQLMQIISAPQTRKGAGVKKMLDYFREIIESA